MSKRISELEAAVKHKLGGIPRHVESRPVKEIFRGEVVWEGVVETFDLSLNPKAKRCYAWSYKDDNGVTQYVTVLHIEPVDSPEMAVKMAIAAKLKADEALENFSDS